MLAVSLSLCLLSFNALQASAASSSKQATCKITRPEIDGDATFIPFRHAGGQSPWFTAPSQFGVDASLPSGCTVDQAAYIVRHGSRYPEVASFAGWVSLHSKIQNATFKAKGSLSFLSSWQLPVDDPVNQPSFLSVTGAGEAFALGVDLRKRYGFTKGGEKFTAWAASQQRVVDTANFFLSGYLSSGHYNVASLEHLVILPDSVNFTFANSLTPSAGCPNYVNNDTVGSNYRAAFQPAVTTRLNKLLDGLTLVDTDIGVMMDLCAYQTEIAGSSPFCDVFTQDEWLQFEYSQDLQYYYGSGPGNPLAATTTYPLVQAITDLFELGPGKTTSAGTFIPPSLLMGFTHDNDIPPVLAVLGLFNETFYAPLDPSCPNPKRKFRSSFIIPFRGTVAFERLSCISGSKISKSVRVKANDAVVPISTCRSGPGSSCPLDQFVAYVKQRGKVAGDFVQKCGLSGVSNATDTVDFFTNPPN
ncbi:hypothetical protein M422DRAFT_776265 [Sphaerobolus stellatus SS14]|nr:hypothetical protein M422DRAFT_776265 [Sphaerobolus stellatus SS14]